MTPLPTIRGICFDLWNTIAFTDSARHPLAAFAAAYDLESDPSWRRIIERAMMTRHLNGISEGLTAIEAATGHGLRPPWSRRDLVLLWGEACGRNRLYEDALPALRAIRSLPAMAGQGRRSGLYRLGILSNTQSFDLDFMRREGLDQLVDDVCLSCDCGLLKPDPAIFQLAARRLGLNASEILMVGDRMDDDVEAAAAAGMRAILLDRKGRAAGTGATVIRSLSELPALLISS